MKELHTTTPLVTRTFGTGNDLVLLHGWGMNSGAFTSFIPCLSDNFRVTTIDLPGFGENALRLPTTFNVNALAKMIAPFIPDQGIVVGWSLGGLVAQKLMLINQTKYTGLVNIASTPRFIAGSDWPGISAELLAMFEHQLDRDYEKTLDRFLAIQAMGSKTARQDIKTIRQHIADYPRPSARALKEGLHILSTEDLRSEIGKISVPTLRIYGRLDSLVPTKGIEGISKLQPRAEAVVLPHASHAPFISHPKQTAEILHRFASRLFN